MNANCTPPRSSFNSMKNGIFTTTWSIKATREKLYNEQPKIKHGIANQNLFWDDFQWQKETTLWLTFSSKKKCSQKMNAFKIIFIVQHMRSWEPKVGKKKTSTGFVKNAQKIAEQQYKQHCFFSRLLHPKKYLLSRKMWFFLCPNVEKVDQTLF